MENIGYIKLYRSLSDSDIWYKPAWWFKVWSYILMTVKYEDNHICKKWENFFTADQIYNGCNLRQDGVKKRTIYDLLDSLQASDMIRKRKTTRGIFISVLNYAKYQDQKNLSTDSQTDNQPTDYRLATESITKEGKNKKRNIKENSQTIDWFIEWYETQSLSFHFMTYAKKSWITFSHPLTEQFRENLKEKLKKICEDKKKSLDYVLSELEKMVDYHATKWNEFSNTLNRINTWFSKK